MKRNKQMDDARNGWYWIHPDDAKALLDAAGKNRSLSDWRATKYADAIKRDQWSANGESIIFDNDGKLRDGQHRLQGCVMAGVPILTFVVYMPKRTDENAWFDTIDTGKARSNADRLSIDGADNAVVAASVVRFMVLYGKGKHGLTDTPTAVEVRTLYDEARGEINAAMDTVNVGRRGFRRWASVGLVTFCYLMARRVDADAADRWLSAFCTGEKLQASNPVYKLREALQEEAMTRKRGMTNPEKLALMIRSFVYFRNDYSPTVLTWRAGDPMPKFDDAVRNPARAAERRTAKKKAG